MKKIPTLFWILAIFILLSACDGRVSSQPTLIPSKTPKPSITLTPASSQTPATISTLTTTPTLVNVFPFTPTPRPTDSLTASDPVFPPYPTKKVVFEYLLSGNLSYFDIYVRTRGTIFVIYSDGQFITTKKSYREKKLSSSEINRLLSQLETKGFYSIDTDQTHKETDALYNFDDQYFKVYDGGGFCVLVHGTKARTICAYEPFKEFLVPKMKNILQLLDEYTPENLSSYHPDRILINVEKGRSSFFENTKAISWPNKFPSLETFRSKILYVEGTTAAEIFALLGESEDYKIVNEDDLEYTINIRVVLPHETLSQP